MSTTSTTPGETTRLGHRPWMVPGAAVAGIGGPLVLAVCNALVNFTPGWAEAMTTEEMVEVMGQSVGISEAIVVTGLLAVALIVPGIWAVAARLAPGAPVLAAIGGWMMATGYVFATVLSFDSLQRLLVAQSGLDVHEYGAAMDAQSSWIVIAVFTIFGFGALLGGIVLAVAMLRQRAQVPLWAGIVMLLSEPVRIAGLALGIPVGPPLASILIAVAFGAVILRSRERHDIA
jgi:hypothetical protein